MAELLLKIDTTGPNPAYQDGDIVSAFNDKHISFTHAAHITHPKNFRRNSNGFYSGNSLLKTSLEILSEFKFERISRTEIRRTNLITLDEDILGPTPNINGEYIDVALFLKRRKSNKHSVIFGSDNSESWYGGRKFYNTINNNDLWAAIEANTRFRKINFTRWPLSRVEKRHFLALRVDDFTDVEAVDLQRPVRDIDNNIIKRRRFNVNWPLLSLTVPVEDIRNQNIEVDTRDATSFTRSLIVVDKGP